MLGQQACQDVGAMLVEPKLKMDVNRVCICRSGLNNSSLFILHKEYIKLYLLADQFFLGWAREIFVVVIMLFGVRKDKPKSDCQLEILIRKKCPYMSVRCPFPMTYSIARTYFCNIWCRNVQ